MIITNTYKQLNVPVFMSMEDLPFIALFTALSGIILIALRRIQKLKANADSVVSENKVLRGIIDAIPDPVIAVNTENKSAIANRSALKLAGISTPKNTSPELYQQLQSRGMELNDQSAATFKITTDISFSNGSEMKSYQRSIINIYNENNFTSTLIHYKDVTAQYSQLQASKTIATRYFNAFNNSPAAMAVIRIADGKILDCNSSFETLTGFSKKELSSSNASIFKTSTQLNDILNYVRDNRKLYNIELSLTNVYNENIFALGSFEKIESESEHCMFATLIDITEWKRTEQALIDSENFAYTALDALGSQIAILDECSILLYTNIAWNNNCSAILGQHSCNLNGSDLLLELTASNSSPEFTTLLTQAITAVQSAEKQFSTFDFSIKGDDDRKWYSSTVSKFRHGVHLRILISIDNISELKRAEQEREHSELKYKSIFENSTEGIFQSDANGNIITVNPAMAAIFGYATPERFLAAHPRLSTLMGIKQEDEIHFFETLNTIHPWKGLEFTAVLADGGVVQLQLKARQVYNAYGEINLIEGTIDDITERKAAEAALLNSELTLRTIFDNTIQSFVLLDNDLKIIKWNSKAEAEITGITGLTLKKELHISHFLPKKHIPAFELLIMEAMSGETVTRQIKIREISGVTKWMEINLCSYQSKSGMKGVILSGTDITLAKHSEEKINNQMTMLQKTNHELDRFVYSVSHDLRAPLTSILGLINIASFESTSPVMQKHLDMIGTCVNRLDGFIQDILNYARNSRQELKHEAVNFRQVLAESRSNLKYMKAQTRIRIKGEINDFTPFHSDVTRISIILNNLLSNAVKYSDPDKADPYIEITITTEASRCTITIADNGIGIHPDHQNKVFEMFYRVSKTVTGSGLGLYIVKETVNKLNGTIHLVSQPGEGTIFTISLPESTDPQKNFKHNEIEN